MVTREPIASLPIRRRWLRFSLRTLLVLVTVCGVWLGIKVDQARRQKEAVEALRALGAEIWYEHQRKDNGGYDVTIELEVPGWARELCGDDFFQTVTGVSFLPRTGKDGWPLTRRTVTDEDLKCLSDLPHLEQLLVFSAPITDAGLAHLRYPERLRVVMLDYTEIGDGFVRRLKGADRLESLCLDHTKVTDDALAQLTNLTKLQVLRLRGTDTGDRALAPFAERELFALGPGRKTTSAGLQQFRTLAKIIDLQASNCQFTGEAFRGFKLPSAMDVSLSKCDIGDNDLAPLVEAVRDVPNLSLAGCPITDQGLRHLKELGKTRSVDLANTKIQGRELGQLSSLAGLLRLDLSGCPLDEPDFKGLEPLYSGGPGGELKLAGTSIADDALASISGFTNLTFLDLSRTIVTDQGLPHLYSLKLLRRIDLTGTRVTAEGVRQFKQAIPGLEVAWDEDVSWRK